MPQTPSFLLRGASCQTFKNPFEIKPLTHNQDIKRRACCSSSCCISRASQIKQKQGAKIKKATAKQLAGSGWMRQVRQFITETRDRPTEMGVETPSWSRSLDTAEMALRSSVFLSYEELDRGLISPDLERNTTAGRTSEETGIHLNHAHETGR